MLPIRWPEAGVQERRERDADQPVGVARPDPVGVEVAAPTTSTISTTHITATIAADEHEPADAVVGHVDARGVRSGGHPYEG